MDWFDTLEKAGYTEAVTWAGIVNLVTLLSIFREDPSVAITKQIANLVIRLVEGGRRYRAEKHGWSYVPASETPTPARPQHRLSWLVRMLATLVFLVVCIAAITAAKRFE
jgi:hypothetical protein